MTLKISNGLSLPDEAVTQTFGIMAKRGVGKTYTANVMTEEMLKANLHVVVIDPIGVWYGLRSSADGKSEGLPIIIAGGEHADIPIMPESGETLANLIIDNHLSMVVDVSLFRKGEQTKFMTAFAETMYRKNRNAIHLVVDEADAFAPQRPQPGQQRMLGAMEDLVRRGRAKGIGMTMITQRPAVLNKNVLTQIEVLVALRLTAPQDQKAIDEWVKSNAEAGQREEFMGAIASLPIGTAYFWSPGWLKIFQKVQIRKRETLDSSSTPVAGKEVIMPKKMAAVDLEALRDQLLEVQEKVESNDPKVLKKRITELERQLAGQKPQVEIREKVVEVVPQDVVKKVSDHIRDIEKLTAEIDRLMVAEYKPFAKQLEVMDAVAKGATEVQRLPRRSRQVILPQGGSGLHADTVIIDELSDLGDGISNYAQSLLQVFKDRWPMQISRSQLAILSGRKPRSSAFAGAISELVKGGLIRNDEGRFELTNLGMTAVEVDYDIPKPSLQDTIDTWVNALPPYERDLFKTLLNYRHGLTRQELAEKTGRSITSSGFSGAISTLVKNGLVVAANGRVSASDMFFEEEL